MGLNELGLGFLALILHNNCTNYINVRNHNKKVSFAQCFSAVLTRQTKRTVLQSKKENHIAVIVSGFAGIGGYHAMVCN